MNNKKQFGKYKKSFSIGEVMLSVFILGVVIVTVAQLFASSYKNFADSRDMVIASMLAQEGVELVRNIRDNNWAQGNPSFDNIDETQTGPVSFKGCPIDPDNMSCSSDRFIDCVGASGCSLYFHSNTGLYTNDQGGGQRTKFKRRITITEVVGTRLIISMVRWDNAGFTSTALCAKDSKCVFSQIALNNWGE